MTRLSMTASGQAEGVAAPRILLVDDEPRICDFISRALETAGYMVDAAGSGTEGLRRALEGDYDLIILDLITPDLESKPFPTPLLHQPRQQGALGLSWLAAMTHKVGCLAYDAQDFPT